ncbi:MAG: hypothetical protein ABI573_06980 [Chloroflexota bacterium]
MNERDDEAVARLARRLRSYLADEAPPSDPRRMVAAAMNDARPRTTSAFAAAGALATIAVVLAVAFAAGLVLPQGPGASSLPTVSGTASGSENPPTGSASLYPDGLPRVIDGEVVYRAGDPVVPSSTEPVLVTGWTVGWIVSACGPQVPTTSAPRCPIYAQLAETPGGPTVLLVESAGAYWSQATGVVVRVQVDPNWRCPDTASCVAPIVSGLGLVWQAGLSPTSLPSGGISESQSIALAGTSASGGIWAIRDTSLLTSVDSGVTWKATPMTSPGPFGVLAAFVADAADAWTVTAGPGSTDFSGASTDVLSLVVHRTVDGGMTWSDVTIPGNYPGTLQRLVFVDPTHGYLMASAQRQSLGISTILATSDGGASWSVAGAAEALGTEFSVSDRSTLWSGAQQIAGGFLYALLDVSRDAGRTWADAGLPGLVGAQGGGDVWLAGPPQFVDRATGFVTLVMDDGTGTQTTRVDRTTDGGKSWSTVAAHLRPADANLVVIDANDWLLPVANPFGLLATDNAGTTWHEMTTTGLGSVWVDWMDVISGDHLVALVSTGNALPGPEELRLSSDGGQTWQPAVLPGQP